jgi:predicted flap endonuclease-1-like 5' DNA nuclease
MEYLIQEIFVYLVIAFVIGAVIGWIVCNQGASKKIAALEAQLSGDKTTGTPIEKIEGIGAGFGKRLKADGITTTEALLDLCRTDEGVARVCQCVELDEHTVRNWGTMADLMRIKGLGGQWAELMWRAGVSSVQDLAQREIVSLRTKMREINDAEHRVAELPGEKRVTKFIAEAGQLDPVLPDRS